MTTDIKPDTSGLEYLSPEWFLAMAEIEKGRRAGKVIEYDNADPRHRTGWSSENQAPHYFTGLVFRLKPEPRVVWVNFYKSGNACAHETKESATLGATDGFGEIGGDVVSAAVRFVESPE